MLITEGGPDMPEVRQTNGTIRGSTTASLNLPLYPWMDVAPDGRAFYSGPDRRWAASTPAAPAPGRCTARATARTATTAATRCTTSARSSSPAAELARAAPGRHQPERGHARRSATTTDGDRTPPAQPDSAGRRHRARHRRELIRRRPRRPQQRRLHRRSSGIPPPGPGDARLDAGDPPVPLDRAAAARRAGALRRRRHLRRLRLAGLPGQERRGVLPALPVQERRVGPARPAARDHLRARDRVLQRAVLDRHAQPGRRSARSRWSAWVR